MIRDSKKPVRYLAPSKINPYLKIIGKRSDGYHEIETILLPLANPLDVITLSSSEKGKLNITASEPDLPCDSNNLCWKAAQAFAELAQLTPEWSINIKKHIPIAAGMGGGSSDAAAVLKILQQKYPVVSDNDLKNIACKLGADVPFFLNPIPSLAKGIGEVLSPLILTHEIPLVIVYPKFPVSAKWAYANYISETAPPLSSVCNALKENDLEQLSKLLHNDLAVALYRKFPLLSIIKEAVLSIGAMGVEVSGSGPSLFAVCRSVKNSQTICSIIQDLYKDSILCFATSSKISYNQNEN